LESSLGLKLTQIFQTRHGAFVPEVHGLWLHDFFGDHMKLQTTFSGVAAETGPFWTGGPSLDRNLGDVGVGISFISCVRLAIQLDYNYQFGKSYHAQHGLIKITQRF
jgi:outer membrane autotransporter protein